jgi:hypothetical protein
MESDKKIEMDNNYQWGKLPMQHFQLYLYRHIQHHKALWVL